MCVTEALATGSTISSRGGVDVGTDVTVIEGGKIMNKHPEVCLCILTWSQMFQIFWKPSNLWLLELSDHIEESDAVWFNSLSINPAIVS